MITTLKIWWHRLSSTACGRWFLSKMLGFLIPYTGTISPTVLEISPGYAKTELKDRRLVRNHLRSIHAIALANIGELTTGLALHFGLTDNERAILTNISVEYLKKARGTITGIAQIDLSTQPSLGPIIVQAKLFDKNQEQVATVNACWLVRKI